MTEEIESLKRVVELLNKGKYEYALTGSMAMSFYTVPRMTRDADILIKLFAKDTDEFFKIFSHDYYIDKNMLNDSIKSRTMFNILDKKTFFKIDFIFNKRDEFEEMIFQRKTKMKVSSLVVHVISIEDLMIAKLNWAKDSFSEMQLNDIRQLTKNNFDKNYVLSWVKNLNLENIYNKL